MPVSTEEAGFLVFGGPERATSGGGEAASQWSGRAHGKEEMCMYVFALGQLGALCGVPLAVVVGVVIVARTAYVLYSRRE